jgi:hypothetical protein
MLLRFLYVLHPLTSALGAFRGVVVDGHSIGRPCCKVHNCTHPLINNRKHFCHMHHASESKKCVITDCSAPVEDGFRTCSNPAHREMENHRLFIAYLLPKYHDNILLQDFFLLFPLLYCVDLFLPVFFGLLTCLVVLFGEWFRRIVELISINV